jgi:hypothetical protein
MDDYDLAIRRSFAIIPKFGGVISIIGSTLLARHIITPKKKPWGGVPLTGRMLFWISIVDIIVSFFVYFMSTWMAPRGSLGLPFAAGITRTCTAQGFILLFGMTYFATTYSALAVLYWLIVHRGWTKNQMEQRRIRFSFLVTPVVVALCFAVPPLFFQMYNANKSICFLKYYPPDCKEPAVECTRGTVEGVNTARIFLYGYMLLGNIVVLVFMCLLIFAVYRQEKKSDRYIAKGQEKNRKNTRSTAWQGVRFSAAYILPYFMFYVFFFYHLILLGNGEASEALELVFVYWFVILTPMLGAFNSAVYFYPRYASHKKQYPEKSRMVCLCDVLGLEIGWCCPREDPEIETLESPASTPLINEEEGVRITV